MDYTKDFDKEDLEVVANAANCSKRYVKMTVEGDRGARNTQLQQVVLKAWDFRMIQRTEEKIEFDKHVKALSTFCNKIKLSSVTPK